MKFVIRFALAIGCLTTSVASAQNNDIERCYLVAIKEVRLPATDTAMLAHIDVEEGDNVEEGQVIAQIDDREAVMAQKVARYKYEAARKKAESEISIEAAIKSHQVAGAEFERAEIANKRTPGSYTETEVRRLQLNYERAGLQIDLAREEALVATIDARAALAEHEQASEVIDRRKLKAPHNGFVAQIFRHKGDWVAAGDPVLHLVRMDTLRVHGRVDASEYSWGDLLNRPIDVIVTLPGGREHTVSSQIAFASNMVEDDGSFRIWADVENERLGEGWLLGPGLKAVIRLK